MTVELKINPDLDLAAAAAHYAEHDWVQIKDFFTDDSAAFIGDALENNLPWNLVMFGEGDKPAYYPLAQLQSMPPQEYQRIMQGLYQRSGDNYGFVHLNYRMVTAYLEGTEPGHPIHRVTEFVNSPEFIDRGRRITGDADIRKADAQATLYRQGDYIGWHTDQSFDHMDRSAAFTLGFTRNWKPDWGGQLALHDENGDVKRALQPAWNTLTLFRTPQPHSVMPVTYYAQGARMSVIGWLRRDV